MLANMRPRTEVLQTSRVQGKNTPLLNTENCTRQGFVQVSCQNLENANPVPEALSPIKSG